MRTRNLLIGVVAPLVLALGVATPAFADTTGGGGGQADLGLDGIAITSATVTARTGIATVSGTITCSQDLNGAFVFVELDQVVGRFHTLRGYGGTPVDCAAADGSASWSVTIQPDQGKFANGRATIGASAEIDLCGEDDCVFDFASVGPETIRLGH
jgi:hypothetical protein